MKIKFDIATHRTTDGTWKAQVLLGDTVIHEDEGVATETQAVNNVKGSFALLLRELMFVADERLLARIDAS